MRMLAIAAAAAFSLLSAPVRSQNPTVTDVGLTLDGGMLTVIYGRSCGTFTCTPHVGGSVGGGENRTLTCFGAPGTAFVVALGLPAPVCFPFPGIANSLMLDPSALATIGFGVTGNLGISICPATGGRLAFPVPPVVPPGIVFRLQGLATSPGLMAPAFTNAIEAQTV
jgi:hypothetical protein